MSQYRKKPVIVEATQWFKNGDHPKDNCMELMAMGESHAQGLLSEGKIVRYYRHPDVPGQNTCMYCNQM